MMNRLCGRPLLPKPSTSHCKHFTFEVGTALETDGDKLDRFVADTLGRTSTPTLAQRRTLTQYFLKLIEAGGPDVKDKYLRIVFGKAGWGWYREELKKLTRCPPLEVRKQFANYINTLKYADAADSDQERRRKKRLSFRRFLRKHSWKRPYRSTPVQQYERALEHLEELLFDNPGLQVWLDRPVCFSHNFADTPTPDIGSVPRLINSRSPHATKSAKVRAFKIAALKALLRNIER